MMFLLPWLYVAAGVLLLAPRMCLGKVAIEGTLFLPDGSPPERTTLILGGLHGAEYTTFSRAGGSFIFQDVPPGVYSLEVGSITHAFPAAKVKVPGLTVEGSLDGAVQIIQYSFPGAKGNKHSPYPIQLQAHSEWEYFNKREGLKIFSLFKNPMVLIMGISAIMMFALPKVIWWFLICTYITIIIMLTRTTYHPTPPLYS
eukprot:68899_1